jgi:hypothetical protein
MPQLLIIDPVMPGVSGVVVAKEICSQIECKVLLINAAAQEPEFAEVVNNLRNKGCDCEAFPLPFEKEDLLEHVRQRVGPAPKVVKTEPIPLDSRVPIPVAGSVHQGPTSTSGGHVIRDYHTYDWKLYSSAHGALLRCITFSVRKDLPEDHPDQPMMRYQRRCEEVDRIVAEKGCPDEEDLRRWAEEDNREYDERETLLNGRPGSRDSTSKVTPGTVPKTDLPEPKADGETRNRASSLISLATIDALLKSANVVTRIEGNSLMFKGFIGETRIEISPSGFRTADGLEVSEIIQIESVLEKMPVTWNDGVLCTVNMAASNGALTVDSNGRLRIKSRISLFRGEPRKAVDAYLGIVFLGSIIHTNAVQASIVDAWHLPIAKAESLPDTHSDGVWAPASFDRTLSMIRNAGIFANGDASGLTAEFPWDAGAFSAVETFAGKSRKRTSLLRIERTEHPTLGHGLFCRLDLPLDLTDTEAFKLAIELNKMEFTAAEWPPFLGAWTSKPGSGRPTFVSFWPNCFAKVISLELISTWHAARAERIPEWVRSNTGIR